ncbi:MAG: 50S ribosomal protein L24 [Chloroflexi bacterium]|nr:50S ribosomal protein L24 [Chloroflexota bacterium]
MHVKKDDTVVVLTGKDKGHRGKIHRALPKEQRVIVEGAGIVTKHAKPRPGVRQGGIIKQEAPIHVSKVMLVCKNCGSPTRTGHRFLPDGKKIRHCKKCGEET